MEASEEKGTRRFRWRAAAAVEVTIAGGAADYVRRRDLPRVLPVGPDEVADESLAGRRRIVARLARALRAERNRGRAGHWTYDLNRHIALRQAYLAERRALPNHDPGAENTIAGSEAPGG